MSICNEQAPVNDKSLNIDDEQRLYKNGNVIFEIDLTGKYIVFLKLKLGVKNTEEKNRIKIIKPETSIHRLSI